MNLISIFEKNIMKEKYALLTIIKEVEPYVSPKGHKMKKVECICECGNKTIKLLMSIKNGDTQSCGCLLKKSAGDRFRKHGEGKQKDRPYLYNLWIRIKDRCNNKNLKQWKDYGGRGIKVYKPWVNDYLSFKKWILNNLGERPIGKTLDRINNNGDYEPENLKWSTSYEQVHNRRCTIK